MATHKEGTRWSRLFPLSSPASIKKTECPARARFALEKSFQSVCYQKIIETYANDPPPGPEPMITYSYSEVDCATAMVMAKAKGARVSIIAKLENKGLQN